MKLATHSAFLITASNLRNTLIVDDYSSCATTYPPSKSNNRPNQDLPGSQPANFRTAGAAGACDTCEICRDYSQSPVIGTVAANHAAGNSAEGVAQVAVLNYQTGVRDDAVW